MISELSHPLFPTMHPLVTSYMCTYVIKLISSMLRTYSVPKTNIPATSNPPAKPVADKSSSSLVPRSHKRQATCQVPPQCMLGSVPRRQHQPIFAQYEYAAPELPNQPHAATVPITCAVPVLEPAQQPPPTRGPLWRSPWRRGSRAVSQWGLGPAERSRSWACHWRAPPLQPPTT